MEVVYLIIWSLVAAVPTTGDPQNHQQNAHLNLQDSQRAQPQQPVAIQSPDTNRDNLVFQPRKQSFFANPNSHLNVNSNSLPDDQFQLRGQTYKRVGNKVVLVDDVAKDSKTNDNHLSGINVPNQQPNQKPNVNLNLPYVNALLQNQQALDAQYKGIAPNINMNLPAVVKDNLRPQLTGQGEQLHDHGESNKHDTAINAQVETNRAYAVNHEGKPIKVIQYDPNLVKEQEVFSIKKNKFDGNVVAENNEPKVGYILADNKPNFEGEDGRSGGRKVGGEIPEVDVASDVFDKKAVGDSPNADTNPDLQHQAAPFAGRDTKGAANDDVQPAPVDVPSKLRLDIKEEADPPAIKPGMHNGIFDIPFNNVVNNGPAPVNMPQVPPANSFSDPEDSDGSMKIIWDWSDFAVNFEQYVMPEQKIRRAPHASTGEPWPMPQYYVKKESKIYQIDTKHLHFKLAKVKCDIIDKALERYRTYILEDSVEDMYDNFQHAQSTMIDDPTLKYETPLYLEAPSIAIVSVKIRRPCAKFPTAKSDETYDLFVKRTGIYIWANEVWGALRGLETLSQLIYKGSNQELYIRDTVINDYPRFSHRGVMIDSARHFIFKETIFDVLEGMAQNKMNVLHWHLVDDQSFPYQSRAYPDLSEKGAFHPTFVYTPEDVADIIEFARLRGIRVMPEFDIPGHSYSWGLSRPDLLTQCYQGDKPVDGYLGPMDPSKNETFRFLKTFMKEALHSFRDQYIHLGGDEVPMTCWSSNPEIMKFLGQLEGRPDGEVKRETMYYYSYDVRKVLEYFVSRLINDVKSVGSKRNGGVRMVFWQEVLNNNIQLPNDTIIQIWQGGMEDVQRATSEGLNVIYSTCWYLDLIEYGTKWAKYYQCDPVDTTFGYSIDESKVLGGEACLWAEYIDNENLMSTLWPRASAAAERLWSNKDVKDLDAAAPRLQEHRCRMLSRGLSVGQISGPDYCLRRGKGRHRLNETISSNCTQGQCAVYSEKSRVEVEKIKVEFEQKGGHMSDCSQAVIQAGGQLALFLLLLIIIIVFITFKFNKSKVVPVRMCKNRTILLVFVSLVLVYFMCYTTIWLQAMEFRGSFEKHISSNVQDHA